MAQHVQPSSSLEKPLPSTRAPSVCLRGGLGYTGEAMRTSAERGAVPKVAPVRWSPWVRASYTRMGTLVPQPWTFQSPMTVKRGAPGLAHPYPAGLLFPLMVVEAMASQGAVPRAARQLPQLLMTIIPPDTGETSCPPSNAQESDQRTPQLCVTLWSRPCSLFQHRRLRVRLLLKVPPIAAHLGLSPNSVDSKHCRLSTLPCCLPAGVAMYMDKGQ